MKKGAASNSVTDINSYSRINESVAFQKDITKASLKSKVRDKRVNELTYNTYGMLKPRMRGGKSYDRENTQEDDMSKKVNYDSRNNQRYDDEDSNYEESQESEEE